MTRIFTRIIIPKFFNSFRAQNAATHFTALDIFRNKYEEIFYTRILYRIWLYTKVLSQINYEKKQHIIVIGKCQNV